VSSAQRVLVTGAGGYIGRHVVNALLDAGAEVTAVGRSLMPETVDRRVKVLSIDLFEPRENVFEALGRPDVLIHLAWESGFNHNAATHMTSLSSHYSFLTQMVASGLKQLVVLGTMHEIGYHEGEIDESTPTAPQSLYGIAKDTLRRALELHLADKDVVFQWVRAFYIFGDDEHNQSIFTRISAAAERGDETFPFTTGTNKFDFVHVEELAEQIAAASLQTEIVGVINAGSGEPVSLATQVEKYISENQYSLQLIYGAYPDRPYDSPETWGNSDKIQAILAARAAQNRTS